MSGVALNRAACIGGGVIGAGWIARLLLAGVDVDVFDPAPDAQRIVAEVLANAQRAAGKLLDAPRPPPASCALPIRWNRPSRAQS